MIRFELGFACLVIGLAPPDCLDPGDVFLFVIIGALVAVEMRDAQSV
jgi:hypothetical protein